MSFLDSLENNLKALEGREEKDPEKLKREQEQRDADRAAAVLRTPYAEALKKSPFTSEFLTQCRSVGHGQRVLVQFTWLGEILRLDARTRRLELIPTAECIAAVYSIDGVETAREILDLKGDPAALAQRWLTSPE